MPEWNRYNDIRLWDLNENSTRFDEASAAPTDDQLYIQWIGTATIAGVVAFFSFLLMVSILRVREVRNKSFNCYILAVVFPDFQFSLSCSITCAMNAVHRRYVGEAMCGWQTWYAIFGFAANCWMNAVISNQLFTMLKVAHSHGRYAPPTIRHVGKQTLIVYTYAALLASVCTWNVFGIPYKGGIYQGYACLVKDYDDPSTIFFWLGFLPLCVFIPMAYVIYCIVRVFRNGMLPPPGQRSTLYMYFSLIFVFVFMWLPFILITFAWGPARPGVDSTWVLWIGAQFSHLQGLATVWTILFKVDIRSAFVGTISCGKLKLEQISNTAARSRSRSSGTGTERTRNISGSIQLLSVVSQPSRTGSTEDRRPSGLESINEILGSVSHVEPREPRDPRGEDKANIADKEQGLFASEKKLGSSLEDNNDGSEEEDTFRDNGPLTLQVHRYETSSDEEMGMANPAGSSSSSSSSRRSSSSSRPSIVSVESSIENDLMIADLLPVPTEMQRMVYEDAVTLGVEGNELIRIPADEEMGVIAPVCSGEGSSSPIVSSENYVNTIVDCIPSDMQRIMYEDAVSLGIGGEDIVQLLSSVNDHENRLAGASSRDTFIENGPKVIADSPPSAIQLKAHEDSRGLQWGKESTHSSLDSDDCSASVCSDDYFLKMFAKIPDYPTPSQQMLFEDAAALQIDCSELINEEEPRNSRLL
mmetsp:Transcript_3957/g.5771  ORF Transcript_3957/g.5771 Transcript_3957/m.5771 type:complete len:699 (+) Transcript_3957:190-2286(+)